MTDDLSEFYLVPVDSDAVIDVDQFSKMKFLVLEFQPAKSVVPVGQPARALKVLGYGAVDVAPAVLERLSELAGTPLQLQLDEP